jgi:hypothetical protein
MRWHCICITPVDPRHPIKRLVHWRCPQHPNDTGHWKVTT